MGTDYSRGEISLSRQLLRFRRDLPDFTAYLRKHSCLVAEGDITPTPLAETYRVRIEYPADDWPKVWVRSPALVPLKPGGRIPHMYNQERLCLFIPGSDQWSADQFVADTIVPWTAAWLHYYELWHATGEWHGGGREPGGEMPIRRIANRKAFSDDRRRA